MSIMKKLKVIFKNKILLPFLNTVFPEQCFICNKILSQNESSFCQTCLKNLTYVNFSDICQVCFSKNKKNHDKSCFDTTFLDRNISLFHYDESFRIFIHEIKYYFRKRLLLNFLSSIKNISLHEETPDIIIPIPLHKKRLHWREFNQATIIAKWLSDRLDIPLDDKMIIRTRETMSQSQLTQDKRKTNIKKAFKIIKKDIPKTVLLVDDIMTTGNTLIECAKELKNNGAQRVVSFTLFRA